MRLSHPEIETGDENIYLLPHKAAFEIRGRLGKSADDSNYAAADPISFVNNGWSLFQTA